MKNYFYLYGHGRTLRVYFVDEKRKATVVASGALWSHHDAGWFGVGTNRTFPIVKVN